MRVVVASRNRHKLREIGVLLADAGLALDLVSVDEVAPECALTEDEPSFEGNALSKARQAAAATGLPALADDSGIEVDALHGAPGVYSARWSGEPCRVGSGRAPPAGASGRPATLPAPRASRAPSLLAADHRGRAWAPSQGSHIDDTADRGGLAAQPQATHRHRGTARQPAGQFASGAALHRRRCP